MADVFQIITSIDLALLKIPFNVPLIGVLAAFFLVYSEGYSWLEGKMKGVQFLLFTPINIIIWFFFSPLLLNFAGLTETVSYNQLFYSIIENFSKYYWLVIGTAVATMLADQILHWTLFGKGKSKFTIIASMSGLALDEIMMRLLLLGVMLKLGIGIPTAIFLQALSYMIYYADPLSSNRRKKANLNLMHGVVIGAIVLAGGWVVGLFVVWLRNFVWLIENAFGKK